MEFTSCVCLPRQMLLYIAFLGPESHLKSLILFRNFFSTVLKGFVWARWAGESRQTILLQIGSQISSKLIEIRCLHSESISQRWKVTCFLENPPFVYSTLQREFSTVFRSNTSSIVSDDGNDLSCRCLSQKWFGASILNKLEHGWGREHILSQPGVSSDRSAGPSHGWKQPANLWLCQMCKPQRTRAPTGTQT